MKKLFCLFLCLLFAVTFMSAYAVPPDADAQSQESAVEEGFQKIAEEGALSLFVNIQTAEVRVRDSATGKEWSTNPTPPEEIEISRGALRQLKSQLRVTFLDEMRNSITVTSFDACVEQSTYAIRTVKEAGQVVGVKISYDFADESQRFRISLLLKLAKDTLIAQIPLDEIEEYGSSRVCTVDVLPSFGAVYGEEKGYLFVPDGSGALIDFSDRYKNADDYEEPVYGFDSGTKLDIYRAATSAEIRMPVFGMKKDFAGYVAMVTSGDALADIKAFSSQLRYGYSAVCSSFCFREVDDTGVDSGDKLRRIVTMVDPSTASEDFSVQYAFLGHEDADYSGMARLYRAYLIERYGLKPMKEQTAAAPFIELFGKTYRNASFLGIPYQRTVKATTFEQASAIYQELLDSGMTDLRMGLYGFSNSGYNNKMIQKQKFDSSLGGKKGFLSLLEKAKDSGRIFVAYDLLHDYSAANSFFKKNNYIRSLNNLLITRRGAVLSTGAADSSQKWLLNSGSVICQTSERLLSSLTTPKDYGVLYMNMGYELYNDFSESAPKDRQQLLSDYVAVLEKTKKVSAFVGSDGANIYMLYGANMLCEIPMTCSEQDIISCEVPFYAMVLHGLVDLTSSPLNIASDQAQIVGMCAQFGVRPTYRLTYCNSSKLIETNLAFLYNSSYDFWKEDIQANDRFIRTAQKELANQLIISHRYEGDLSITTYENGAVLVYNRSKINSAVYQKKIVAPQEIVRY